MRNQVFIVCALLLTLSNAFTARPEYMETLSQEIGQIIEEHAPVDLKFSSCASCVTVFNLLDLTKVKPLEEKLRAVALKLCNTFMDSDVCQGVMVDYFDAFVNNFFSRYLSSGHACIFLKACENKTEKLDFESWKQSVLADKPTVVSSANTDDLTNNKNATTFRILHLTDLHTDLEYSEGSLADCDQPFCCRPESGPEPTDPLKAAQYWGSIAKCDIPLRTVDALLADSKTKGGDIDMIIWTGDNTSHDVWHQTKSNQTLPQRKISELIEQRFPHVPKYPIFGNHECFPADQYDFSVKDKTFWMRKQSAAMWSKWLQPEALVSLLLHGQYAEYNAKTNTRVIALNTQACDMLNFNLIANVTDPSGEIEFLQTQLQIAEKSGQKAFLMGHIPPGDNTCSSQWAERYQVLVDRYENTIVGQFYGHTHNDHIEAIQSVQGEARGVGSIFIAPSGTTYSYQNPSYRIFTLTDHQITNYYQYRLDLNKANLNKDVTPTWDLAYDFKSEYNLTDLSAQSIYDFAYSTLPTDKSALKKYISNYWTGSEPKIPKTITKGNKVEYTCMAQNVVFNDRFACFGIYAFVKYPSELLYQAIQKIQGPWMIKVGKSDAAMKTVVTDFFEDHQNDVFVDTSNNQDNEQILEALKGTYSEETVQSFLNNEQK